MSVLPASARCRVHSARLSLTSVPPPVSQAPMTSPLVEVDPDDVACFFVQLTQPAMLRERESVLPGSVHETLAYRLLNALLDGATICGTDRVLARALPQLDLSAAPDTVLRDLRRLAGRALSDEEAGDRQAVRHLRKFHAALTALLASRPTGVETPAVTPAPQRARPAGSATDADDVELETGLDSSQGSPARPARRSGAGVVPETPEQTAPAEEERPDDPTGGEELFLGAESVDSEEFSTCLQEAADQSSLAPGGRRARLASAPAQKRPAETPPPRRPGGRLSRRTPAAPKRPPVPTNSPATVPAKRSRPAGGNTRAAPTRRAGNVRRAPAPAARTEEDSPEPTIEDSDETGSSVSAAAVGGGRKSGGRSSARLEPAAGAAGDAGAAEDSSSAAERTPDSVFSGPGGGARRSGRGRVEETPESELSTASRSTRASRTLVEESPDQSPASTGVRAKRGSRAGRAAAAAAEKTPDSSASSAPSTRSTRKAAPKTTSASPVPARKTTRKASTRK